MKQLLILAVWYDDGKFAQRPADLQHAALTGLRDQFGTDDVSGIEVRQTYDSSMDPGWVPPAE